MRLGQLSRKLQVKTAEIIDILQSNFDIVITNHPNSKVPEEVLPQLESLFEKASSTKEELEPSVVESEIIPQSATTITVEKEAIQTEEVQQSAKKETPIEEPVTPKDDAPKEDVLTEDDLNIVDGIIKAPKVEVAGIKVVGKIDLPEKKVEIEEEENTEASVIDEDLANKEGTDNKPTIAATSTERDERVKKRNKQDHRGERRNRPRRPQQPLLTPEEERRIQLKEAQKKKIAEQKEKKEQRRKTYNEELKQTKKSASSSKKKKAVSSKSVKKPKPTTLWGKFVHWLND